MAHLLLAQYQALKPLRRPPRQHKVNNSRPASEAHRAGNTHRLCIQFTFYLGRVQASSISQRWPVTSVTVNELRAAAPSSAIGCVMKTTLRIVCWILVAAAIVWWRSAPTSFAQRFVSMPPAMTWDTITKARKASQHPAFCPYAWADKCRIG